MEGQEYSQEAEEFHLTEEEAFLFVRNILNITNADQKLSSNCFSLLNSMIYAMHQVIPFQSIYRCSIASKDRHRPSFSVIKQNMFNKYGGTCETIQTFFKTLLDALGFKADLFPVSILGSFEGHTGIMVHNLEFDGSKHMVEVGCGHPVFTAIPLNFKGESPVYSNSFLKYKYVQRADDILEWLHQSNTEKSEWFKYAELNTSKLVDITYFFEKNEADYTDPCNKFNCLVWASHMTDNRFFAIKGKTAKWSDGPGQKLLTREIETEQELESLLHEEFPQFPLK